MRDRCGGSGRAAEDVTTLPKDERPGRFPCVGLCPVCLGWFSVRNRDAKLPPHVNWRRRGARESRRSA